MAQIQKYDEQVATSSGEPIKRHTVPAAYAICYQVTHVHNVVNIVKPYHFQHLSTCNLQCIVQQARQITSDYNIKGTYLLIVRTS